MTPRRVSTTCRFINADGYNSTGHGILRNNMFAYCNNNPVMYSDPTGEMCTREASGGGLSGYCGSFSAWGGYSGGGSGSAYSSVNSIIVIATTVAIIHTVADLRAEMFLIREYEAAQAPAISIPKVEEKSEAIPAPPPTPTVIYRYYSSKTENLSPRSGIDYDGLSFSTKPPRPGVSAVVTTIEQVNATGILTAIPTGGAHVTVIPTNGTVNQWMSQGQSSIWSQTLSLIVVEWDGGY